MFWRQWLLGLPSLRCDTTHSSVFLLSSEEDIVCAIRVNEKGWQIYTWLHGVTTQKTLIFGPHLVDRAKVLIISLETACGWWSGWPFVLTFSDLTMSIVEQWERVRFICRVRLPSLDKCSIIDKNKRFFCSKTQNDYCFKYPALFCVRVTRQLLEKKKFYYTLQLVH
jgi:hypothetical protein